MAAPWVVDNAILDAIQCVARVIDRIADDLRLRRRDVSIALHELRDPQMPADKKARQIVGRISGYNAVEIVRETLRFRQRLLPAARTSAEVGALRRGAIKRLDNRLVRLRHLVDRAKGIIEDPLHVPL